MEENHRKWFSSQVLTGRDMAPAGTCLAQKRSHVM
jgi:hypothetical protein